MTSGTVEFTADEYYLGTDITADFSWTDAKWNFTAEAYAVLSIYNPSGALRENYVEETNNKGTHRLETRSNTSGDWRARLRIWNGSSWTDLSDYCNVSTTAPKPPPPEPPEPPPPGECPDFWEDPVGWVLCTITNGFSVFVEWFGTAFWTFIDSIQQWAAGFTLDFWQFLQDPVSKIKTWMSGVFVTIQDLFGQISSSISTWWTQTVIDVGIMISSATQGFSSWIDERFTGINDWWADAQTVWGTWWEERLSGVESWINDFSTKVNNWYNSNIQPTIDAIQSRLNDFGDYIKGIPDLLSQWWNDRVIDFGVWIVEATAGFNDWITGFPDLIGQWWNDRVIEMGIWLAEQDTKFNLWVENVLPGIVEDMFKLPEWLIAPFGAIGQFAKLMYEFFTGTYTKEQNIIEAEGNVKEHRDNVKRIIREWE